MVAASEFAAAVKRLSGGPVSDQDARSFLERFPLEAIFQCLQEEAQEDPASSDDVATVLNKVLQTSPGLEILPASVPFARAALGAPSPALRRLGVRQLGRVLQAALGEPEGVARAPQAQQLVDSLLGVLAADADTGTAAEADLALRRAAAIAAGYELLMGPGSRSTMEHVLRAESPSIRLRGLSLLVAVASTAPDSLHDLHASGLLRPLQAELAGSRDVLSCAAALELVAELTAGGAGAAAALSSVLAPQLGALLQAPDTFLQCQALRVSAALLAASSEAHARDGGGSSPPQASHHLNGHASSDADGNAAGGAQLLCALKRSLDPDSPAEVGSEVAEASLDAVGRVAATPGGAMLLLMDRSRLMRDVAGIALGRAGGGSQMRVAALHALARCAGSEREEALLPGHGEDELRGVVYAAAPLPAERLLDFLRQPFPDLRIAAYKLLAALVQREWGAAAACRCTALLERLGEAQAEPSEVQEWRFATVQALSSTIEERAGNGRAHGSSAHHNVLQAAAPLVRSALAQGVYGRGPGRRPYEMATLP